jgi:drug/metabolite transporter (DMT)-like permease
MRHQIEPSRLRAFMITCAALAAFAANSILCRQALGGSAIDAASFSTIRLASGAATLLLLLRFSGRPVSDCRGSWVSGGLLTLYAVSFSFAYLSLSTGTGALILFGSVQATMILSGLRAGERPQLPEWSGLALALGGLVFLVFPGLTAPPPAESALMALSGIAWGFYSLRGRGGGDPAVVTAGNFLRSVPLVFAISLVMLPQLHLSPLGIILAVLSGSLASALGYILWYAALPMMSATLAATVQLAVPILAAAGGVVFVSEEVSLRLLFAGAAILGGVGMAVLGRRGTGPR